MNIRYKTKAKYKVLKYGYKPTVGNGLVGVERRIGGVGIDEGE